MEGEAEAGAVGAGGVAVGQSPDVVKAEEGQDVVKPHTNLHIRFAVQG